MVTRMYKHTTVSGVLGDLQKNLNGNTLSNWGKSTEAFNFGQLDLRSNITLRCVKYRPGLAKPVQPIAVEIKS